MSLKVRESTMVRPWEETPRRTLWLTSLDLVSLSPFVHVAFVHTYRHRCRNDDDVFMSTNVLKEALSKVLVPFYPVAGRLRKNPNNGGRLEIDCNGEGVLFVEAETELSLADVGNGKPSGKLKEVTVPPCDYSRGVSSFPLLMVQLTRFGCGGVCLGIAKHHLVADGVSWQHMINSWAGLARGVGVVVAPFLDRTLQHFRPRNPPQVKFRHLEYQPAGVSSPPKAFISGEMATTTTSVFEISKDQIKHLKQKVIHEDGNCNHIKKLSTFEVVAAHVWRSVCKACDMKDDQIVRLCMPVNARLSLKDENGIPLPKHYFGNAFFYSLCVAKAGYIMCNPLTYTVHKIQATIEMMRDNEYLRSTVDYLESQPDPTTLYHEGHHFMCPDLKINSLSKIPFYETDFGWGKPISVGHAKMVHDGQTTFMPNPNEDGGIVVLINLFTHHMIRFKTYLFDDYYISKVSSHSQSKL